MPESMESGSLRGIRVAEFSHMVMGPTCAMILGDLGAEVIKIEPLKGDNTRRLKGSGAGFFPTFNRNKKSLAVDVKSPQGREAVLRLIDGCDVVIENFRIGAMQKMGLDYPTLSARNPRLVYCALKGFLDGPYQERPALDEVVQMMGGLAYMTGPPGRPLRAGSSVNDIMGGMFGVIAVMSALKERERTGQGRYVKSGLFETCVFLMAQHMAQETVSGQPVSPMPVRVASWAVYDLFTAADGEPVFVGIVSDTQWKVFCTAFDRPDLLADEGLATNTQRVEARDRLIPIVSEIFGKFTKSDLLARLEMVGLPCAPITQPGDLFDDPHLKASGGLLDTVIPGNGRTAIPGLPIAIDGDRLGIRRQPPLCGEHTQEVLASIGFELPEIETLVRLGVVSVGEQP